MFPSLQSLFHYFGRHVAALIGSSLADQKGGGDGRMIWLGCAGPRRRVGSLSLLAIDDMGRGPNSITGANDAVTITQMMCLPTGHNNMLVIVHGKQWRPPKGDIGAGPGSKGQLRQSLPRSHGSVSSQPGP